MTVSERSPRAGAVPRSECSVVAMRPASFPATALARPVLRACVLLALSLLGACRSAQETDTPEGAVRAFYRSIESFEGEPERAKQMYDLLSKAARDNLAERAQRYVAASGKPIGPERMIAPASFLRRFEPVGFNAEIRGDRARVVVTGALPGDRAVVPCTFEQGGWRVDLELPPLTPLAVRPRENDVVPSRPR